MKATQRLGVMFAIGLLATGSMVSAGTVTQTYTSSPNVPVAPDNGCLDDGNTGTGLGGITDAITIPAGDTGLITDVNVVVQMTQTWRSDIQAILTDGTNSVRLINNHDTSGDNYFATLDSAGAALCSDAANCGTGTNCVTAPGPTCQPDVTLNAFNGLEASNRVFTLRVCDRAAADTGNLVSWSVVVERDLVGCTINQPSNVTVSNDAGQCGAVVSYPAPTTSGACGPITCTPPSGSSFPVGTTVVTCSEQPQPTAGELGPVQVQFNVTVNDTQPPTITCPADVAVEIFPGDPDPVVNYPAPGTSDNCAAPTTVCTPPSGSIFPVGDTAVACTSTDGAGNTATCAFTVGVTLGDDTSVLEIPTLNELGIAAMALALLGFGFVVLRRRQGTPNR